MDKVFWRDPYRTSLNTVVNTVDSVDVTLRETVFFAFSGGQESDTGTIGGIEVVDARVSSNSITYTLKTVPPFTPGDVVEVKIDWERRYRLMRLHFAAEIVLVLVSRTVPVIERIGAHISETKSRIDFLLDQPITRWLPEIELEANAIIESDREINSAFSDEVAERRYWEIVGFGRAPCSGTHIRTTGEIGPVCLSRKNIGKGKERIEIVLAPDDRLRT